MIYPEYIAEIIKRIEEHGERAYMVGGCVRDSLLGITPNDFDIAVSCPPEKTMEIFSDRHVIPTGLKHGTVTVVYDREIVELTTFRIDGSYTDSRHPDEVSFTNRIEEDLSRRDFTVNAMAYGLREGLVDIFGGREDLEARRIRAVGKPEVRFEEDALRILRAFRFSAQLGFEIEKETLIAAREKAEGLSRIARERIGVEFIKLLCSPDVSCALKQMKDSGVMCYVLGGYEPSIRIIDRLHSVLGSDISRLGFLLAEAEENEAREILHSLRCSTKQIKGALAVRRASRISVSDVISARRFIADTGVYWESGIVASVAYGSSPHDAIELTRRENSIPKNLSELKINGRKLMELGFCGKDIGRILGEILLRCVDEPTLNREEKLIELAMQYKKDE
ncbi:MAG: CCA tRNA nucleotidyltransferase [Clostridia bacterium]|nr:CCA tRNA nucleotidyltransferase [Clostridia bacterium]